MGCACGQPWTLLSHRAKPELFFLQNGIVCKTTSHFCLGCICFWNAIKGDMLGAFYSVNDPSGTEFVQGLATNTDNSLLFTGDSLGYIRVYDIAEYWVSLISFLFSVSLHRLPQFRFQ
jgi:hypothetical protein